MGVPREHQEKYMSWHIEQGALEKIGEMLSSGPSFRYFDQLDI